MTALRRVIDVLVDNSGSNSSKRAHVPIRDSVLTMLLAECFGGNAYTTMIATVSAHPEDVVDTISTLRYANKASSIVNYVKVNEEVITAVLVAVQQEVNHLRQALLEQSQVSHPAATRRRALTTTIVKRNSVLKLLEHATNKKTELVLNSIASRVARSRSLAVEAASTVAELQSKKERAQSLASDIEAVMNSVRAAQDRLAEEVEITSKLQNQIDAELQAIGSLERQRIISQKETFMAIRRKVWRRQFILAADAERGRLRRLELEDAVTQLRDELEKLTLLDEASQRDWLDERGILSAFRESEDKCRRAAKVLVETYPVTYRSIKLLEDSVGHMQRDIRMAQYELEVADDQFTALREQVTHQRQFNSHVISISERRLEERERELSELISRIAAQSDLAAPDERLDSQTHTSDTELQELLQRARSLTAQCGELAAENLFLCDASALSCTLAGFVDMRLTEVSGKVLRAEQQVRTLTALIAESERVTRSWCFPDASQTCGLPNDRLASLAIAVNAPQAPRSKLELAKAASRSPSPLVATRLSGRRSASTNCSEPSPRRPSTGLARPLRPLSNGLKLEQF